MEIITGKKYRLLMFLLIVILVFVLIILLYNRKRASIDYTASPQISPSKVVAEKTPYAQKSFSLVSSKIDAGSYVFLIELPEGITLEEGKKDFVAWAKSIGLSDKEVESLSVEYYESSPVMQ